MKRIVCGLMLCLVVAGILPARSEEEPLPHLCLDIPFCISMEECKRMVSEKMEVAFFEALPADENDVVNLLVMTDTWVGYYPTLGVIMGCAFQDDALISIRFQYVFNPLALIGEETLSEDAFADLLGQTSKAFLGAASVLEDEYGAPTDGGLLLVNPDRHYDYPSAISRWDNVWLTRVLLAEREIYVYQDYGNVRLSILRSHYEGRPTCTYSLYYQVADFTRALPFAGPDGEYPGE